MKPSSSGTYAREDTVANGAGSEVETRVGVADLAVGADGSRLVTVGLGSCVAIVLHDSRGPVGGLAHVLLPSPMLSSDRDNLARFPETAVPELIARMVALGASPSRITARLVGGASMFRSLLARNGENMGERNVVAARAALDAAGLHLDAEDTGGEHGRSVYFDVTTGRVLVRSLAQGDRILPAPDDRGSRPWKGSRLDPVGS